MKTVWIGLITVAGPPENPQLDGCLGACVATLAMASDKAEFAKRAREGAGEIGLHMTEIFWCEPLEKRLERFDIEEFLHVQAEKVRTSGGTRFGVFHAWETEEEKTDSLR